MSPSARLWSPFAVEKCRLGVATMIKPSNGPGSNAKLIRLWTASPSNADQSSSKKTTSLQRRARSTRLGVIPNKMANVVIGAPHAFDPLKIVEISLPVQLQVDPDSCRHCDRALTRQWISTRCPIFSQPPIDSRSE